MARLSVISIITLASALCSIAQTGPRTSSVMAHALRATEKVNSVNDDEELRHRGYVVGPTLGEGSYAKVKSAFAAKLNKKVALKIINRRKAPKDFQQKFLPRELEIMQLIHHQSIIELYEVMQFNGKVNST